MSDRTIRIEGLKECIAAFAAMGKGRAKSVVRKGLRLRANSIRDTERALSPVRTGVMQKSIQVAGGRAAAPGMVALTVVSNRKSFNRARLGEYYTPYVVNGHGSVPGIDFPQKAFDAKAEQATRLATDYIENHLTI